MYFKKFSSLKVDLRIPMSKKILNDKKCPFINALSIRGKVFKGFRNNLGIIRSAKMKSTVVVRVNFLIFLSKYKRFKKKHINIHAHKSNFFRCKKGDKVLIAECKPLSKTVKHCVIKVIENKVFYSFN
mmetsp:Transcript_34478/g.55537  ORF Transcript_34478/g.55537 Transcript_34478/m.55537 type:complete len:128 (+) Transcript_34478:2142-2525(+)